MVTLIKGIIMAESTKERILRTALELFAQNGYLGTSMNDIAGQLGITKAALYKHYASKQEILDKIVERMNKMDYERAEAYEMPETEPDGFAEAYLHTPIQKIRTYSLAQFDHWTKAMHLYCMALNIKKRTMHFINTMIRKHFVLIITFLYYTQSRIRNQAFFSSCDLYVDIITWGKIKCRHCSLVSLHPSAFDTNVVRNFFFFRTASKHHHNSKVPDILQRKFPVFSLRCLSNNPLHPDLQYSFRKWIIPSVTEKEFRFTFSYMIHIVIENHAHIFRNLDIFIGTAPECKKHPTSIFCIDKKVCQF